MKIFLTGSLILTMLLSACASQRPETTQTSENEGLNIVTTIAPLYSYTVNLVEGTDTEITNLVPPGTSVHDFQLTPEAARQLHEADLVIINGIELEEFLEDILAELEGRVVDTSEGVELLRFEEDEHEEEEEDGHGEFDPHIWLSPANAKIQVENILNALTEIDSENSATYQENFTRLSSRLDYLQDSIQMRLDALEIRPYVVFHDAYRYFEQTFNIHSVAFLEGPAGQEPSAQYLAEVVDIISQNSVEVMFTEPQFSPKLVETLSSDYDLAVAEMDSEGQNVSRESYFDLMNFNVAAFESVFTKK